MGCLGLWRFGIDLRRDRSSSKEKQSRYLTFEERTGFGDLGFSPHQTGPLLPELPYSKRAKVRVVRGGTYLRYLTVRYSMLTRPIRSTVRSLGISSNKSPIVRQLPYPSKKNKINYS